jgi:hypothetical protein
LAGLAEGEAVDPEDLVDSVAGEVVAVAAAQDGKQGIAELQDCRIAGSDGNCGKVDHDYAS